MNSFKILSYDEEKKLSLNDKIVYYKDLKNYLQNKEISYTKKFSKNITSSFNKTIMKNILNVIKKYDLTMKNTELIPNSPVIYASTHQDLNDHINIVLSIPDHAYILNNVNIPKIVKLALKTNGVVLVDRNNPASRFNGMFS